MDETTAWPLGCHDTASCERHRMCMYHQCRHTGKGAALGTEIDAATSNRDHQTTDPDMIWLEPGWGAPDTGRLWCQDDVWSGDANYASSVPPTKYIRADLVRTLIQHTRGGAIVELRELCKNG